MSTARPSDQPGPSEPEARPSERPSAFRSLLRMLSEGSHVLPAALLAILLAFAPLERAYMERPLPADVPNAVRGDSPPLMTQETHRAIDRGLKWLAKQQSPSGEWRESEWSLPVSSLAALALTTAGHPGKGPFSPQLKRFTDKVLKSASRTGLIRFHSDTRPALGHGFAMLFLSQVYGMMDEERNRRIHTVMTNGIRFILAHQTPKGGWYEDYSRRASHYWIITVSQIQALREARRLGFPVSVRHIERAIKFVQDEEPCTCSAPCYGMNGAQIVTLLAAGDYKNPLIGRNTKKLYPLIKYDFKKLNYPIYTHLYAAQAINFNGGDMWDNYYLKLRQYLLKTQTTHGSWQRFYHCHASRPPEKIYATAVACIILQMPQKYLPMMHYR